MSANERTVTIGADPEIPLYLGEGGLTLKWKPATSLFGGDKGKPVSQGPEGGWLEDGAMLELNPTPANHPYTLADNIGALIHKASLHIKGKKDKLEDKTYPLALYPGQATIYLDNEDLDKFPQLKVFGCSEDFSAYTPGVPRKGTMEEAFRDIGDNRIRFAGGHLHLGLSEWPTALPKFVAVKFFDLFFLVPYLRTYARNSDRDAYYGLPGLYRETSYGVEYRTPCPGWLRGMNGADRRVLMRFFEVGMLFARFEQYQEALVDLYNKVPWGPLYEALSIREYGEVSDTLERAGIIEGEGHYVQVDDLSISLRSFPDRGVPGIFPKSLIPNPAKATSTILKEQVAGIDGAVGDNRVNVNIINPARLRRMPYRNIGDVITRQELNERRRNATAVEEDPVLPTVALVFGDRTEFWRTDAVADAAILFDVGVFANGGEEPQF